MQLWRSSDQYVALVLLFYCCVAHSHIYVLSNPRSSWNIGLRICVYYKLCTIIDAVLDNNLIKYVLLNISRVPLKNVAGHSMSKDFLKYGSWIQREVLVTYWRIFNMVHTQKSLKNWTVNLGECYECSKASKNFRKKSTWSAISTNVITDCLVSSTCPVDSCY